MKEKLCEGGLTTVGFWDLGLIVLFNVIPACLQQAFRRPEDEQSEFRNLILGIPACAGMTVLA